MVMDANVSGTSQVARREDAWRAALRWGVLAAALLTLACERQHVMSDTQAAALTGGRPQRGRVVARLYGCGACHTIPGVDGANSLVGPPLAGIANRAYIAGVLTNEPDHLVGWIENPQLIDSKTAMPTLGVSDRDARDIAAYLSTLR